MKRRKLIFFLIPCIGIFFIYYYFTYEKDYTYKNENMVGIYVNDVIDKNFVENNVANEENTNECNTIKIYITGEIKKTGVYQLPENSRISDAINIAEGVTENANINHINLAFKLEDGMQIYIPNKNENLNNLITDKTCDYVTFDSQITNNGDKINSNVVSSSKSSNLMSSGNILKNALSFSNSINKDKKININSATQEELEQLPGIGTSTALKICNYRKENGKFKDKEDIKKVSRNWRGKV